MQMFNPSHPGELLREEMGDSMTITALAELIGTTRSQLSMILNGRAGISASMSLKLDEVFGKSEGFYFRVQQGYDLAEARKEKTRLEAHAKVKPSKSNHPDFEKATIYVRKKTRKAAWRKWEDMQGGDFSELVERLLDQYVNQKDSKQFSSSKAA